MSRMTFIGVSTGASSIMGIFPRWAEALGLDDATLDGEDLPLDASAQQYRTTVAALRDDPDRVGALVTTHKMALYDACHDLFDELDDFARACGEISSIAKRDGRLLGHAKDPITARLALEEFFPSDGFGGDRDAVVLGAGGAGTALTWCLAEREDRPRRVVVTDTSPERLSHLSAVHERRGTPRGLLDLRLADDAVTHEVLAEAPGGSLVVNATGLGKDRPGSPLPDDVLFPEGARVWEFNYRGTLEFLAQARAQQDARGLDVVDGWRYFIHGWTQVIAEVYGIPMPAQAVERLARLAER
ncbi:shikimate dehydrogenase family protein [Microbacterium karelineae]|uniref:shikimate dehydrogenase family protein n=1 Tax=Microbacterium karelineae TaxID=2654283 RepID=UPI0012EA3F2F|nr:shikimate dehydrogenase [Microbacterium karelineae]